MIAVITSCQWEEVDRKLDGDGQWRSLGDPVYDAIKASDCRRAVSLSMMMRLVRCPVVPLERMTIAGSAVLFSSISLKRLTGR